jgi:AcrR family transcriptional regulator
MEKQAATRRRPKKAVVKAQVSDAALVARRREQLVAAAVDLFAAQGYDRTTMLDIARKAGVSVGLIYQYAQTKEDVLFLSLMSVLDSYKQEIPRAASDSADPFEDLWLAIEAYARIIDRRSSAAVLAYRSTKSLPRAQRAAIMQLELETNQLLGERVRACVDAGLFRDINVDLTVYQIVLHAHGWALKHWRLSQIASFDAYLATGFEALIRACATPQGLERYGRFLEQRSAGRQKARKPR